MANGNGDGGAAPTPPYVGWGTFRNFLRSLHETGVPPVIDTSVMSKKSGGTQAALKSALYFFDLIDSEDRVQKEVLDSVVKAAAKSDQEWGEALRVYLLPKYEGIVSGLPIKAGTAKQLENAFREKTAVTGSTLRKSIRFYLTVLKQAGVEHSPHFRAPSAPPGQRSRAAKKAKGEETPKTDQGNNENERESGDDDQGDGVDVPEGYVTQPFHLPGRKFPVQVVMPADMKSREWNMVSAFMDLYVKTDEQ